MRYLNRLNLRTVLVVLASAFVASLASIASAQTYPSRPIRLVVPVAAGGGSDLFARALSEKLSIAMKQPVIVENRTGAGGAVGVQYVSKAAPDGYTLSQVGSALVMVAAIDQSISIDVERDLEPVAMLAQIPMVLEVHPDFPAKSVSELIALAKANPGKYNFASFNLGGPSHFAAEMLNYGAGINIPLIPYKGSAPALIDVLSGRVPIMFDVVSTSLSNIEAGKLRPLAVTTTQRSSMLPSVPTMQEEGVKGFDISAWVAIFAPTKTDPAILDALNRSINQVLGDPAFAEPLAKQGWQILPGNRDALKMRVAAESKRWREVAKAMNMKLE